MADQPRRVNFSTGMLLTAEDLAVEQEYHRGMRYLHNRLHGFGTVSGLEVDVGGGSVRVGPGLAIDRCGREIVVTAPLTLRLEPRERGRPWLRELVITWHENPDDPVPGAGVSEDEPVHHTRWVEQPVLSLVATGADVDDGLVLARLSRTPRGAVQVDPSVRRSLGPADDGEGAGAPGY
jgi:hypothetical protein